MEKGKKMHIALLCLLLVVCLIGAIYFYQTSWKDRDNRIARSPVAEEGYLPGMSEEELREEMNRRVDDSELAVSINSTISFPSGKEKGYIRIENSESNHYLLVVEMYRKDNGDRIYFSGAMEPGYYVEQDKLEKNLSKGVYEVEVHFKAYNLKTENYVGETVLDTTVQVLG